MTRDEQTQDVIARLRLRADTRTKAMGNAGVYVVSDVALDRLAADLLAELSSGRDAPPPGESR